MFFIIKKKYSFQNIIKKINKTKHKIYGLFSEKIFYKI